MQEFAASAQQRAFWFTNEIDPGTPVFNLLRVLQLKGIVHRPILARAFDDLIARHEVLRTGLVERNGVVVQHVHDNVAFAVEEHDFSSLSEDECRLQVDALAVRMSQSAFDLAVPPHLRVAVARISDNEHVLVIVFHHVIIDGSSMGTFFDDLAALYEAQQNDKPALLPKLSFQYSDFSERQDRLYARSAFEQDVAFWRNALADAPPLLALPTVHPRSAQQGHRGKRLGFDIDERLTEALRALCSRHVSTLYMGLLSAFQILLQRWADTDDVVIGTPVSGSRDEDFAHVIGCFVNTLALRGDLSGDPTFVAMIARNRSILLDAFEHQHVPFERVVAEIGSSRTPDHSPIFQVMFVLQNFRHQVPKLAGLEVQDMDIDPGVSKLDLSLEIIESDGLACSFEFNSELFDPSMMARMADQFRRVLETVVGDPERAISRINLLGKDEWQQAVLGWNSTAREYLQHTPAEAFAAITAQRPGDVALISGDQQISFGELSQRAGQVAVALRGHAGGPVGIFLPRSVDAFAAILGCLVAGIPWVPLDTAQPDKRLEQLVELAGCRTVLTLRALSNRLPAGLSTVVMDRDASLWSTPIERIDAGAGDVAYVLFTSGSTGVPKGVMGATKALMNRIDWMHEAYPFAQGEVACCKTSIGFVDSVWEMLGPLLAGVPTVIVPDEVVLDPEKFIALLGQHRVSRIVLVPTLLRVLLDHAPDLGRRLPALAMWSVSGELLTADLVRRFKLACPGRKLINLYGSSEVAADVLVHEVGDADADGPVPIGKPIANTQVYVLDCMGQPAPVGMPGVIHAGGACLALGYWSKPDLTAERFRPNPIAGAPSPILFNTGDRGVWQADGTILYLGRNDNQVKLRGVRLELDEILTALRSQATVKDAAAMIIGDADQQRLVAFVVGHPEQNAPVPSELRAYLQERLPSAAVPAKLFLVDALPLLPSGKVDQMALKSLADAPVRQEVGLSAMPVNGDVAELWRTVLREDDIQATDDFFDLGGNSLLAMQVIVRVRRRFAIDIPIRALFDNPTLAAFSRAVEDAPPAEDEELTEIRPRARSKPAVSDLPLSDLRRRLASLPPKELDALIRSVKQGTT
ncbi:non-ribosomal peptide synthetase [Bradyrhizobium sp. SYSU BS000235]|uniref:non-ribosomal peptide synthetase n=1 Tax=Bradyrhizobium sp. SYSU BS000235 TaxID=3411332 RepID=UPI003C7119BD